MDSKQAESKMPGRCMVTRTREEDGAGREESVVVVNRIISRGHENARFKLTPERLAEDTGLAMGGLS